MNKLEVLRSDYSIRKNMEKLAEQDRIHLNKTDISTLKISALLKEASIANTELEQLIPDKAEQVPDGSAILAGQRGALSADSVYQAVPDDREVCTLEYTKSIKNNKPLENNYLDGVRGNVIKTERHDSTYCREFDYNDHQELAASGTVTLTNSKHVYKKFFLATDAINSNKITNCFAGKELENGAALSFWVRFNTKDTVLANCGLFAFLGDHTRHYFDDAAAASETEYVDYTSHLSITCNMNAEYDEAFSNTYKAINGIWHNNPDRTLAKILYRGHKNWIHVTTSFTNEGICIYLNGIRVPYETVSTGKRFFTSGSITEQERHQRINILDFIRDEHTSLYLGLTLDEDKISDSLLFDDITFYDASVQDDTQAMNLYQEALTINLP
ncbi:MAG: hypothetical protein HFI75_00530 [Lachnospiraceae bacterium]|nr:hypothetical protein [Lachnospiraceae bacterium]